MLHTPPQKERLTLLVQSHWGNVFLGGDRETVVPRLTSAGSAPWCPSHAGAAGIPPTVKFGGCSPSWRRATERETMGSRQRRKERDRDRGGDKGRARHKETKSQRACQINQVPSVVPKLYPTLAVCVGRSAPTRGALATVGRSGRPPLFRATADRRVFPRTNPCTDKPIDRGTQRKRPGMHWKGGRYPPPRRPAYAQPLSPDGKCQLHWHL